MKKEFNKIKLLIILLSVCAIFLISMLYCIKDVEALIKNNPKADIIIQYTDNSCSENHICSKGYKIIELNNITKYIYYTNASIKQNDCEFLCNKYYYCADGWFYNINKYKIIHDSTIHFWALSEFKPFIELSHNWQSISAGECK